MLRWDVIKDFSVKCLFTIIETALCWSLERMQACQWTQFSDIEVICPSFIYSLRLEQKEMLSNCLAICDTGTNVCWFHVLCRSICSWKLQTDKCCTSKTINTLLAWNTASSNSRELDLRVWLKCLLSACRKIFCLLTHPKFSPSIRQSKKKRPLLETRSAEEKCFFYDTSNDELRS